MKLRNIAIIAHVDHGKTTLVDKLLQQSGSFRDNQRVDERVMDSNDLEKERGITILAKATSVVWKDTRINIVDTPGHADFGGEVERILSMVDGVIVLVDAAEGPMPQTKFVVSKALKIGLQPDRRRQQGRPARRARHRSHQRGLRPLRRSRRDRRAARLPDPLRLGPQRLDGQIPGRAAETTGSRRCSTSCSSTCRRPRPRRGRSACSARSSKPTRSSAASSPAASPRARVKPNQTVKVLDRDGNLVESGRVTKILAFRGLERQPIELGEAGDIVSIAGLVKGSVADTFCAPEATTPIQAQPIDPPTVTMSFIVNDSPLAGTEGDKVTSRMIRDRLFREGEGNVTLKIEESTDKDSFFVSGRGELQLAILIETMRREGFEIAVSRPRVVMKKDEATGELLEPIEEVVIDVDEEHSGIVVQKMSERRADMLEMRPSGGNRLRLVFHAPTRGLIGYQGELMTDTRGTAIMNRLFHAYAPFKGEIAGRRNGVLISNDSGEAVAYAMWNLEDRGPMMIEPGWKVYQGMIVGEHNRDNDLEVNVLKGKKLTNIRTTSKDEAVRLTPPIRMTLERSLAWIQDDELVEVTPKSIRLRKAILDPNDRKRADRAREAMNAA